MAADLSCGSKQQTQQPQARPPRVHGVRNERCSPARGSLLPIIGFALLAPGCHALPSGVDSNPWPSDPLCPEGVTISNAALGAGARLSALTGEDEAVQGVGFEFESDGSFRDVWRLVFVDADLGTFRIQNVRPPNNFLTSAADARGTADNFEFVELGWILQRTEPESPEDTAWFELIPQAAPETRLGVEPSAPYPLLLVEPGPTGSAPPKWAKWAFERAPLCGLYE